MGGRGAERGWTEEGATHLEAYVPLAGHHRLRRWLISVSTFAYSFFGQSLPKSGYGEVVALVQDSKTSKPIGDASIEIVTDAGPLLTTITSGADGRAHHKVKEGAYKLRVTHPRFGSETRKVRVNGGETSKVTVALDPRPSREDDGENPIKKFFRGLGL